MRFPRPQTLKHIADLIQAQYMGDDDFPILGINEIHRVEKGDIVFVDHPKYYDKALNSAATVVLINKEVACPVDKALLISDDPFRDFVKIGQHFMPFQPTNEVIASDALIGEGTHISPQVVIGKDVHIGKGCYIHPNVTIGDRTVLGDHVIIHSGTVLGGDAFYYKKRETGFDKLKSVGNVVIEDEVEIGANCTIDRGVTATTLIGKGTKMDNQIQIGHDTIVGEQCLIASQVGIAGCCNIGNEVIIWGQAGITSNVSIGNKAVISAKSGVSKSLEGGKLYMGTPAEEGKSAYKKYILLNRLPELFNKK
ncbi:UDP-3-O-(3-hydroxymyristoyl)glucosamine N-acyltransferase [Flavobacteriaceae bacterium Ap0902]|nr:UDP-3-O-(3-hydroxymyristoyl)glucosamine N-acyltransferase [Flavobacteriaceae bacterium Ap0902]